ncbi:MAG: DUF4339 domain-containing protein, partial [Synergistaceae bacterium]|nr:DUF4339 domain-containing protein [Synergistaceae bacterium]
MRSWYYMNNDQPCGPLQDNDIRKLIRDDLLPQDALVWNDEDGRGWVSAAETELSELFNERHDSPAPPSPEYQSNYYEQKPGQQQFEKELKHTKPFYLKYGGTVKHEQHEKTIDGGFLRKTAKAVVLGVLLLCALYVVYQVVFFLFGGGFVGKVVRKLAKGFFWVLKEAFFLMLRVFLATLLYLVPPIAIYFILYHGHYDDFRLSEHSGKLYQTNCARIFRKKTNERC